jgi:hypothetical protein
MLRETSQRLLFKKAVLARRQTQPGPDQIVVGKDGKMAVFSLSHRLYTGSFRTCASNVHCVSIARSNPKSFSGKQYFSLAPTRAMLKLRSIDDFYRAYKSGVLDKLNPLQVLRDLGPNAIMCCWEDFNFCCHRRMVGEWLEEQLGITVPEIGHEREESPPWRELPLKSPSRSRSPKNHSTNQPGEQGPGERWRAS